MEAPDKPEAFIQSSKDGKVSENLDQPSTNRPEERHRHTIGDWEQELGGTLDLQLQDSHMSPALSLLPSSSLVQHTFTDYSLFQQSDSEFAPLRASPDISVASEKFHSPPLDHTSQASELRSLSQHPLAQATVLSEDGASSSCCSLSQHSISPGNGGRQRETSHSQGIATRRSEEGCGGRARGVPAPTDPQDKPAGTMAEDDTSFLSADIPAHRLLESLEKDVGVLSSSDSAVSSVSERAPRSTASFGVEPRSARVSECTTDDGAGRGAGQLRGQPLQGGPRLLSDISNITMGSRNTQPDDSSEALHRELLSQVGRHSSCEGGRKEQARRGPSDRRSVPPHSTEASTGKASAAKTILAGTLGTGPRFSAGVKRNLWSSGNQTGIDGSYLGFLPESQSTPGIFNAPAKSSVKVPLGRLSAIESRMETSGQSISRVSQQPDVALPGPDATDPHGSHPGTVTPQQQYASDKVQALPCLNYMEKVDAWRWNQSSGRSSLFDSLALQGFSGVSPKKKAYDAISDSLNRMLSQHLQQPAVSTSQASPLSTSFPRRGEATGSAPNEKEERGSSAGPPASPLGRSQSHSSLSTVVTAVQVAQRAEARAGEDSGHTWGHAHQQPSSTARPPPLVSPGHFSDVSLDGVSGTLSHSQDSYFSGQNLGASVGASSVLSLEVDNYAPYWNAKPSSPRPRELNIEERIPLYLHNLGIDQSPSAILTPFGPRGPIREPEFSPTDLCTIKGSIGTPTKSTQLSEVGTPHKGEFSRCSLLSVDSSMSIPLSADSLCPAASLPEQTSFSPDTTHVFQAALCQPPPDASYAAVSQPDQQVQWWASNASSSQSTVQPSSGSLNPQTSYGEGRGESSSQAERIPEDSFVGTRTLQEIRNLLSQGGNAVSPSSPQSHLHSDNDILLSLRRKVGGFQDSSFVSSSASGSAGTRISSLWARSRSESMLMSDRQRETSVGRESEESPRRPSYLSTQAAGTDPDVGPCVGPQESTADGTAGSLLISQSAGRAEPEGCSAAPSGNTAPTLPPPTNPPPAASQTQQSPRETAAVSSSSEAGSVRAGLESTSSSPASRDIEQGMSDGSSQSSLSVRVARLLQNESSSTLVSSTASTTQKEEGGGRDWTQLKVSGQQHDPLDVEDRKEIEKLKRELQCIKSQDSTDTESSALSTEQPTPEHHLPVTSSAYLEAYVREIAVREGVTLPRANPRAPTSITIATCKRSTSPSPSTSPAPPPSPVVEPLHLNPPSTLVAANRRPPPSQGEEDSTDSLQAPTSGPAATPGSPGSAESPPQPGDRRDAVGGQAECPPPSLGGSQGGRLSSLPPVGQRTEQAIELAPRHSHISHLHLTLAPKGTDVQSRHTPASMGLRSRDFSPLQHSSCPSSSPDEGLGLSSPPEYKEPVRTRGPEGNQTVAPEDRMDIAFPQSLTSPRRPTAAASPLVVHTPTVPVLLPYKPHGSEELFYMPHTESQDSSCRSDTTMESSHSGSDDAVPPRFSSEVLGKQDPGLDRGVTIRHTEGIYSKRLKTTTSPMQTADQRVAVALESSQTSGAPRPSSPVWVSFSRVPLSSPPDAVLSRRDQGTSPMELLGYDQVQESGGAFRPVHVDTDYGQTSQYPNTQPASVSQLGRRRGYNWQSDSSLDQLWRRFNERRGLEDSGPTNEREVSLLERLERLERLIRSTAGPLLSAQRSHQRFDTTEEEWRRKLEALHVEERGGEIRGSVDGKARGAKLTAPRQVWTQEVPEEDSRASLSSSSSQSQHLCPAERDQSETTSGSVSTVDTARLVRAFGADRVRCLKTGTSLRKLYSTTDKQKEDTERRRRRERGRPRDAPDALTPSESTGTDDSIVDSTSSTASTFTVPYKHSTPQPLSAKKAVKLVNKGIQAGDLEIVTNGTRRHTRDVGTTFPSPSEAKGPRQISSSSERGRGGFLKERKSNRGQAKRYPQGVSWFVPAEELKAEARKENLLEEQPARRPSAAWFEPYSQVQAWREPLRQRHIQGEWGRSHIVLHPEPDAEPRLKATSSGLVRISLQEALAMRRPEFVSQSRERMERLALQVAERKHQAAFSRERELFFNQSRGLDKLPRSAGSALFRRAVSRKEMIQRSKHPPSRAAQAGGGSGWRRLGRRSRLQGIYEKLPEVQRRREEERRNAEYRSYRLNAQLYNKKITSRVLGRRVAWH